ncbi:uncharacterized protein LOC34621036 [Cyclospora cayetanensis]|uniref:Uncharacterized protein LOC34621036 n=1 Tax=Cyclospora cayetanensis TaxID=88456 RepID=A0A6P6S4W7_9EIME|nr:uncharacterized protein LOC34621036 [Cyclospora cayetanensis]
MQSRSKGSEKRKPLARQKAAIWPLLLQTAVIAAVFLSYRIDELRPHEGMAYSFHAALEDQTDDLFYCSATNAKKENSRQEEECIPCPANADCVDGKMACNTGYRLHTDASQEPQILAAATCVEDLASKAKAAEVLHLITELLRERQGRHECGLPLDPLCSPSDHGGRKPWSDSIKAMCFSPGLTRWQMHFHPDIASSIANEAVYHWLFNHLLTPESAAEFDIEVEKHYLFVPLANPVEFPELHERLVKEQSRSRGITYTYTYKGSDLRRPFSCRISASVQNNLLPMLTVMAVALACSYLSQGVYIRYYVRKEVLSLIRLYSRTAEGFPVAPGISTEDIYKLLASQLASKGTLTRLILKKKLTLGRVDEACHDLLYSPNTRVHAYQLHEANHWWAEEQAPPLNPHKRDTANGNSNSKLATTCPAFESVQHPPTTSTHSFGAATVHQWNRVSPQPREHGNTIGHPWQRMDYQVSGLKMACRDATKVRNVVDLRYDMCVANGCVQRMIRRVPDSSCTEKPTRGLDDYLGLIKEYRELQQASHRISAELARQTELRSSGT